MSKFRVVKVLIDGKTKYAPQYFTEGSVLIERKFRLAQILLPYRWELVRNWKKFYMIVEGTDEWIPCYYNTKKEAWGRIDLCKKNTEMNLIDYDIIAEYYE